jgi:hypothetical protein
MAGCVTVFTLSRADSELDSGAVWMSVFSVCRNNMLVFLCVRLLGVKMAANVTNSLYVSSLGG